MTLIIESARADANGCIPGMYAAVWNRPDGVQALIDETNIEEAIVHIAVSKDLASAKAALELGKPMLYRDENRVAAILGVICELGTDDDIVRAFRLSVLSKTARLFIIRTLAAKPAVNLLLRINREYILDGEESQICEAMMTSRMVPAAKPLSWWKRIFAAA